MNSLAKLGVWRCTRGRLRHVGQGTVPARMGIRFFLTLQFSAGSIAIWCSSERGSQAHAIALPL